MELKLKDISRIITEIEGEISWIENHILTASTGIPTSFEKQLTETMAEKQQLLATLNALVDTVNITIPSETVSLLSIYTVV